MTRGGRLRTVGPDGSQSLPSETPPNSEDEQAERVAGQVSEDVQGLAVVGAAIKENRRAECFCPAPMS